MGGKAGWVEQADRFIIIVVVVVVWHSFCTESIYFWLDCNEYKDIPHKNYLKLRAQKIFRKYISQNAKLQVNIEATLTKEVVANLEDPNRNLFVTAQNSITRMLEKDTLPKFRKSKHVSFFSPVIVLAFERKRGLNERVGFPSGKPA